MVFAAAGWLVVLVVPPVLWLLLQAADRRAERRAAVLLGPQAPRLREGWHARTRSWRRFFHLVGLCWLVLALARPQWGASEVTITQRGHDVVIALDVSRSMLAEDVTPSRLERAKAELTSFLRQQTDSRVGLVLFAGAAFVQSPLTGDLATAEVFLQMAAPDMISAQGTALATALRISRELLQAGAGPDAAPGFQAILLVTDGEDLEGGWEQEAEACRRLGITVIPVGIGEATGGLIPVVDEQGRPSGFLKDPAGNLVLTRLDLAALERLAAIGGGSAFRIGRDGLAGERLRSVLDALGRREFDDRRVTRHQERYQWPLGLAIVHLCLSLAIAPRRRQAGHGGEVGPVVGAQATTLLIWLVLAVIVAAPPATAQVLQPGWSAAMERGRAAYAAGDFATALQEFELARAQAPDEPRLALAVGEALFHLGRLEEAAQEFERARALSRDVELRAESRYNAGTAALAQGDATKAMEHLRESLRLMPDQADALHNLEAALRLQQQQQQQDQDEQQDQQDQDQQDEDQQGEDQQGEDQQGDDQDAQDQQDPQQQPGDEPDPSEQQDAAQPDQQPTSPQDNERTQPQPQDAVPEMDREQALQLLNALDRDEQELKRSIQQRLRGEGARSGREW